MMQKKEILPRVPLYYSVPMLVICIAALLILVLLFRIEYPSLLLQPVPANAINVSSCGILGQDNSYYIVNQTLNVSGLAQVNYGGCLLVNASNVVVDGNGQNLVGSLGLAYTVMNLTGSNVIVKGFNVSDTPYSILRNGILSYGSNNLIFNNQFSNVSEIAIYSKGRNPPNEFAIGTSIYNNTILDSSFGVFLHHTNHSNINNNFIKSSNVSSIGIYLLNAYNNTIYDNIVRDTNQSILLWVSDRNSLNNNLIYTPMYAGIGSISSEFNSFTSINITSPQRNGVYVYPSSLSNVSKPSAEFDNVNVINGNPSYFDFDTPYFSGATLYNHSISIVGGHFARYKLNNTYLMSSDSNRASKISYNVPLVAVGNNLTDHIRTSFNFAEVKSNLNSDLNRSATLTFAGLPTNISNVSVFRNGVSCSSNICTNLSNVGPGIYSFIVSGWTNYTINWTDIGSSNNSTNTTIPAGAQSLSIDEPDSNEQYLSTSFPNNFVVTLGTINGSVKFSLNNGLTNTTMVNTSLLTFVHSQTSLNPGNYTFIAYANFTNGTFVTDRVNFSVILPPGTGTQTMIIDEPDSNEQYTTASFPVTFRVILSVVNGSVKFSLNDGATNVTMLNDSSGVEFEHIQNSLSSGNYTFIAFANFTNGTRITSRTNFSVVNTAGSSVGSGSSGGSSSGGSSSGGSTGIFGSSTGSPFNSSTFGTTTGSGETQTLNSQSGSSSAVRNMIYWLLIAVLSIMIVILSLLIIKAIQQRRKALSAVAPSGIRVVPSQPSTGLISNLR